MRKRIAFDSRISWPPQNKLEQGDKALNTVPYGNLLPLFQSPCFITYRYLKYNMLTPNEFRHKFHIIIHSFAYKTEIPENARIKTLDTRKGIADKTLIEEKHEDAQTDASVFTNKVE